MRVFYVIFKQYLVIMSHHVTYLRSSRSD